MSHSDEKSPRENCLIVDGESFLERLRQFFFSIMSRNSSSASDYFNLPSDQIRSDQILELGAQLSVS